MSALLLLLSWAPLLAIAAVTPTFPGPGEVFKAGSVCPIQWNVDNTGTWTNATIHLMSGSNGAMTFVANVVSGLDGTNATLTPYNWTCPCIDPYSNIYFYQFSNGNETAWTTRFTIASSSGDITPPAHATQPDGSAIPWGTGSSNTSCNSVIEQSFQGAPAIKDNSTSIDAIAAPTVITHANEPAKSHRAGHSNHGGDEDGSNSGSNSGSSTSDTIATLTRMKKSGGRTGDKTVSATHSSTRSSNKEGATPTNTLPRKVQADSHAEPSQVADACFSVVPTSNDGNLEYKFDLRLYSALSILFAVL